MQQAETKERNTDIYLLLAIVAFGIALRTAAIAGFAHVPESDETAYQRMAVNLLGGRGIVDVNGNYAMSNVGYPLFVLAPTYFILGVHLLWARVANLVLGIPSILLSYCVAKEAGAGRIGRLFAATLWAGYLPASVYTVYLAKEDLMIPLMLGVIWCALRLARNTSWKISATCGVLFGLLALVGNAGLSLAATALLALWINPGPMSRRLASGVLIVAIATTVTAPWLMRNERLLGAPVLNTNGGFNLYLGNNPAATGWFMSIRDTPRGPVWEAMRKGGEVQASETLKRDAISWIKDHPAAFLMLAFRKAAYFWLPPFHDGKGPQSTAEQIVRTLWSIQFVALAALALASLTRRELRNSRVGILWSAVVCYTAVHMLFYVIFRYREPIMPVLTVLVALTIESFLRENLTARNNLGLASV